MGRSISDTCTLHVEIITYTCSLAAHTTQSIAWPLQLFAGWLRGTVVERRSLAGELTLSCARPAADR